jgi:hypothetical protein
MGQKQNLAEGLEAETAVNHTKFNVEQYITPGEKYLAKRTTAHRIDSISMGVVDVAACPPPPFKNETE